MKSNDDLTRKKKPDTRPYCLNCNRHVGYKINLQPLDYETEGIILQYNKLLAMCSRCGHEIYVPLINDMNVDAAEAAYVKAKQNGGE